MGCNSQFQQSDFDFIPHLVTAVDNTSLCREPNLDEIRHVVFFIDLDSAPSPDEFCSKFYQSCWDIICRDLLDAIIYYFRGSVMPRAFQSTLLMLLPKKTPSVSWSKFKPISLCNMSNKVITKLLVLRLTPLLSRIISPTHSDFVTGRVIYDNILLIQELV